ncbi:MAG: type II toxin-antitoxin system HicA family toxin [Terriglobales bacterium]
MGKKFPKLKPSEVKANLRSLNFKHKRTTGSHETWERLADPIMPQRQVVQVDVAKSQFDDYLMKSMIRQSGFDRDEFCTGVVSAARSAQAQKTALPPAKPVTAATAAASAGKKSN